MEINHLFLLMCFYKMPNRAIGTNPYVPTPCFLPPAAHLRSTSSHAEVWSAGEGQMQLQIGMGVHKLTVVLLDTHRLCIRHRKQPTQFFARRLSAEAGLWEQWWPKAGWWGVLAGTRAGRMACGTGDCSAPRAVAGGDSLPASFLQLMLTALIALDTSGPKVLRIFIGGKHMPSRPGWMELWATWSSGSCPCSWQGGWNQMIFKVPSNPNHSTIPWFTSLVSLCEGFELLLVAKISPQIRTVRLRTRLFSHEVSFSRILLLLGTDSKQVFFPTPHSCCHLTTEQKKLEFHSNNLWVIK